MSELLKQLTSAARDGKIEVIRRILVSNYDYLDRKNEFGNTALHLAATFGKEDCVKLLIDKGADILAKDLTGATALHHAASLGNFKINKFLVEKGADVNLKDNYGRTPIDNAITCHHPTVVEYFKKCNRKDLLNRLV